MKNLIIALCILFFVSFSIGADETEDEETKTIPKKNIKYEIGFSIIDVGLSNNLMSIIYLLKNDIEIDLDKSNDDIKVISNGFITPLYFRYYTNNKEEDKLVNWLGFGVSTFFEAFGYAGISNTLISLGGTANSKSEVGASVFAGIGAPFYFNIKKFNITLQPSVYFPFLYIDPDMSYVNYINDSEFVINYSLRVYSNELSALPGFDFKIYAEYPLSEVLGLKEKNNMLDFDVGLNISGIPIIPSTMKDYMEISGLIKLKEFDFSAEVNDTVYGKDKLMVFRPFKMLAWVNWRPIDSLLLSFVPVFGFSVNPIYTQPVSFEGGLTTSLDIKDFFIVSLVVNYTDRYWKNGFTTVFYFTNFEIDFGLYLRAEDFIQAWQMYGIGAKLGFKYRW